MSKFDQFKGGPQLLPDGSGNNIPAPVYSGRTGNAMIDAARAAASKRRLDEAFASRDSVKFAIALDATLSMQGLLDDAKISLSEIIKRITREAGQPVQVQLFAYRDYDMGSKVLEQSPLTGDANALLAWLQRVHPDGGGGNDGEAIEAALAEIRRIGGFKAVIVAGDEPPNSRAFLDKSGLSQVPTAESLASQFGDATVPIHTFVVGDYSRTKDAFAKMAKSSGGTSGRLDGSEAMIDMAVMGMLAVLKGSSAVLEYAAQNRLSATAQDFATLLIAGPST